MLASKYLTQTTRKSYNKKASMLSKAKPINNIGELTNVINSTTKRHMKAIQFHGVCNPRNIGEYKNISAVVDGNTLRIFDKTNPNGSAITLDKDAIRAYDENDISISIYPHTQEAIGDRYFNMIVLRKA